MNSPAFRSYGPEIDEAIQAAFTAAEEAVDDHCRDNYRVADITIPAETEAYDIAVGDGCCGFFEGKVEVSGRTFKIGFNYGH